MFRTTDIFLIALMVCAAAFTYKTKHDAERQYAELRRLQAEIRHELDTLDLLKADWSLLTQPKRLQRLAEIYETELGLKPVEPHQIVEFTELPVVPVELDGSGSRPLGGFAATTDPMTTGGTGQ